MHTTMKSIYTPPKLTPLATNYTAYITVQSIPFNPSNTPLWDFQYLQWKGVRNDF